MINYFWRDGNGAKINTPKLEQARFCRKNGPVDEARQKTSNNFLDLKRQERLQSIGPIQGIAVSGRRQLLPID